MNRVSRFTRILSRMRAIIPYPKFMRVRSVMELALKYMKIMKPNRITMHP